MSRLTNLVEIDLERALAVLAERGWFSRRSRNVRECLGRIARLRTYAKDEHVYMVGDPPNGVFGLLQGSLNISIPRADGEVYTVHRAGSGFWVGDLALFANGGRLISVQAAEQTWMIQLPNHDLIQLVQDDPRLYEDFYALTYENFATTFQVVANLTISSTPKRLADRLLLEAESEGDGRISLSQTELATLTALSLPTLKRALARFASAGYIDQRYGFIRLVDRDGLLRVCKE